MSTHINRGDEFRTALTNVETLSTSLVIYSRRTVNKIPWAYLARILGHTSILYYCCVRVKANVPSLIARSLNSMTVGTAHFTLVDFDLECGYTYPAPNCFCDIKSFERGVDVVELQRGNACLATIYTWIHLEICVNVLTQLLAAKPSVVSLRLCVLPRILWRRGNARIREC